VLHTYSAYVPGSNTCIFLHFHSCVVMIRVYRKPVNTGKGEQGKRRSVRLSSSPSPKSRFKRANSTVRFSFERGC
jgi:hypothetical protein